MSRQTANLAAYRDGIYAPVHDELTVSELAVHGKLPRDLNGLFVSNSPNPRFAGLRHHWFDGDGMMHSMHLRDGSAIYRNRWVRTSAFNAETEAGRPLWKSILQRPDVRNPLGPLKNTANTDVAFHAGRLLALWWLGGEAYLVGIPCLDTLGVDKNYRQQNIAAHPKVDRRTDEMMFLNHSLFSSSFQYGVAAADGTVAHLTTIELPGLRLHHDLAITERYSILLDMPMMSPDPRAFVRGGMALQYSPDRSSRIGVIPRRGTADQVRWFEIAPCFVYHVVNAWEEEPDKIIFLACRNAPSAIDPGKDFTALVFNATLCRWTVDLDSGGVKQEDLDDLPTDFPRMDDRRCGMRSRYSYQSHILHTPTVHFDAVVRYDTDTGRRCEHRYPAGWYGGEAVFAPRDDSRAEDDGYLLVFLTDRATGRSEFHVLDAQDVSAAPVARLEIPQRIPPGFHGCWIPADQFPLGSRTPGESG